MDDLTAFLNARLDEDEAWGNSPECGYHQDPARVLREIEAKRAILAWWQRGDRDPAPSPTYEEWRKSLSAYGLIKHLAAVYSDHPDYRQEWKP